MHFQTITKLLRLPNVIVIGAIENGDDNLHLIVELSDKYGPPVCSGCGAVHTSVHSKGQTRVEDLPISGRRVFLYLEKRKCRCPEGGIYVELLPWLHGGIGVGPSEPIEILLNFLKNGPSKTTYRPIFRGKIRVIAFVAEIARLANEEGTWQEPIGITFRVASGT